MSNSFFHARSSANHWGGAWEDYMPIHEWIDSSKRSVADVRHRALHHHAEGCWDAQEVFGRTITTSAGRQVPVREIAERHIIEDLGWLPSFADYLRETPVAAWMGGKQRKVLPLSTLNLRSIT